MKLPHLKHGIIGATAIGLALAMVPSVAIASPGVTAVRTTVHAIETAAKKPVATASYEVIAGTFKTNAAAQTRLDAITAKNITGLSIVALPVHGKHAARYRVHESGLTRAAARALVKSLHQSHFFARSVRV